jgi:hypothetical protein
MTPDAGSDITMLLAHGVACGCGIGTSKQKVALSAMQPNTQAAGQLLAVQQAGVASDRGWGHARGPATDVAGDYLQLTLTALTICLAAALLRHCEVICHDARLQTTQETQHSRRVSD